MCPWLYTDTAQISTSALAPRPSPPTTGFLSPSSLLWYHSPGLQASQCLPLPRLSGYKGIKFKLLSWVPLSRQKAVLASPYVRPFPPVFSVPLLSALHQEPIWLVPKQRLSERKGRQSYWRFYAYCTLISTESHILYICPGHVSLYLTWFNFEELKEDQIHPCYILNNFQASAVDIKITASVQLSSTKNRTKDLLLWTPTPLQPTVLGLPVWFFSEPAHCLHSPSFSICQAAETAAIPALLRKSTQTSSSFSLLCVNTRRLQQSKQIHTGETYRRALTLGLLLG